MLIRTPSDMGALIRDRRRACKLGQQQLAEKVGVSRQWLIDVEKGKSRAELGLVLRTLEALEVAISSMPSEPAKKRPSSIDLNSIIQSARGKPGRG